jgi:hypothetical protein
MEMQQNDLIRSLMQCAVECENCANACLNEGDQLPMMVNCIRLDRDCATICRATAELIIRGSDIADKMIGICADLCRRCADECERHDMHHCRECARACRDCEEACKNVAHF